MNSLIVYAPTILVVSMAVGTLFGAIGNSIPASHPKAKAFFMFWAHLGIDVYNAIRQISTMFAGNLTSAVPPVPPETKP